MSESPFAGAVQFGSHLILAGSRHYRCALRHCVRHAADADPRDEAGELLWCDWHRESFSAPHRDVVDEVAGSLGNAHIRYRPTHN